MIALVRYVTSACLDAQRWVAPGLFFVLGLAITYVNGGDPLTTLAEGATWLFPVTAWITVATLNDEDPSQAVITAAAAGGCDRARAAKLIVGGLVGSVMTVVSLLLAWATNATAFTLNDLGAGVVAHVLAVVGGVALGSACARPIIAGTGWAVLAIVGLTVIDLVVPGAPPVRSVLGALSADHPAQLWGSLTRAVGGVALLAIVLLTVSTRVSRRRD